MKPLPQRRIGLLFAAIATLGWGMALAFAWFNATLRQNAEIERRRASLTEHSLRRDLEVERRASGDLAQVEAQAAVLRFDVARASESLAQVEKAVAATKIELSAEEARRNGAVRANEVAIERLRGLEAAQREAEQKLAVGRQAIAAVETAVGARTKELAEVRQQSDLHGRALVQIRQAAAALDMRLWEDRAELARLATEKADLESRLSVLHADVAARHAALLNVETGLAESRHALASLQEKLGQDQAAASASAPGPVRP